jgi:oligoendopeptidase F
MKFGLSQNIHDTSKTLPYDRLVDEVREVAVFGDENGFDEATYLQYDYSRTAQSPTRPGQYLVTLAHELGHGVHQYLSRKQGELQSSTPLTTAETASVFGEMLVFEKLMENLDDPKEKLSLLTSKIDDTIATVFRQISMNRFEDAIHTARREEGELTTEQFADKWLATQRDLYGGSVELTDEYGLWWSYIPHFLHTPGYVYAYAFGELLVLALYQSYKNGTTDFAGRYLEMLGAGGSDWPHKLVGSLDMDIKDPGFWQHGLQIFEQMIEQAEALNLEKIHDK